MNGNNKKGGNNMKIASQTEYISARLNDYEAVRMVCEAGFVIIE